MVSTRFIASWVLLVDRNRRINLRLKGRRSGSYLEASMNRENEGGKGCVDPLLSSVSRNAPLGLSGILRTFIIIFYGGEIVNQ